MKIHKEGYATLGISFVVLGLLNFLICYLSNSPFLFWCGVVVSCILYLFLLNFFRNPPRITPKNHHHVIAPCDGKIVVIERTQENEFLKDERIQVSIFMSPLNVHVNRNPIGGTVSFFRYHPGKYLMAFHPKSSLENERTTIVIQNPKGIKILFRQIAGFLARRIICNTKEGSEVIQGDEFGFIKFGSRVDLFLPIDSKVLVNLKQKTEGGITVIAELGPILK